MAHAFLLPELLPDSCQVTACLQSASCQTPAGLLPAPFLLPTNALHCTAQPPHLGGTTSRGPSQMNKKLFTNLFIYVHQNYWTQCSPPPMCYVTYVMCHMSHVMCHVSVVTCQVKNFTCNSQTVRAREVKFSEKVHLLPPVTCQVSYVRETIYTTCVRKFK